MMDKLSKFIRNKHQENEEAGQSIVLIALMLVVLLSFVGLAVDVGFVFARQSQLQAAVDAAALSGVSNLISAADLNDTGPADTIAGQFLNANGVPITGTSGITVTFDSSRDLTALGVTEYSLTVTWPIDLFFLRLIGRDQVNIRKSATAGISYLTDIYASRRVEDGTVSTSTQGIYGPQICTRYGDPFSPWNGATSDQVNPWAPGSYTYRYRIMIPQSYTEDVVRVEIFDPDSVNQEGNNYTIDYTKNALTHLTNSFLGSNRARICGDPLTGFDGGSASSSKRNSPCVLQTYELELTEAGVDPIYTIDQINPFWFVRIDENRGAGTGQGNGECAEPVDASGNPTYKEQYNTETLFELYYFREANDGQLIRSPIASYTGNTGDARDNGPIPSPDDFHYTDMYWVSPGADHQGDDFPPANPVGRIDVDNVSEVPTNEGNTSFEVNISDGIFDISVDPNSGARYLYLDVTSISGASENGFELWAGPAGYATSGSSANVNIRNVEVVNEPGSHSSNGVVVFALGRLPMNSVYPKPVDIPLIFIGAEQAGSTITISLFDTDSGVEPPVVFFFDSINEADWSKTFSDPGVTDPDGIQTTPLGPRCQIGGIPADNPGCNNQWITPPYQLTVPGVLDNCDYQNQTPDDCTPFYGGRLMVRYIGGVNDTYGWAINLSGLPFLIR